MRFSAVCIGVLLGGCSTSAPSAEPSAPVVPRSEGDVEPSNTPASTAAALPTALAPGQGFRAPTVEAVRITTTTEVRVMLQRADDVAPWSGPVRYTAEPFTITGRPQKGFVRERNVLGSGRAFDLDGDGDTKDRFPAACDGEAFGLGDARLRAVMSGPPLARRYDYADALVALGQPGTTGMLYLPCTDDGVSLGFSPEPIAVREIPGPALMVLAFGNPSAPPKIPTDGVTRIPASEGLADQRFDVEVFEPVTEGPLWYAVAGAMVQLDAQASEQSVRVFVEGDVEAVQIAINEGKDGVDRVRSYVSTQQVGAR